jgi:hypothetical protein
MIETGSVRIIHVPNDIAGASGKMIWNIRTKARLGGVPISVAIPPRLHAYAMLNNNVMEKFLVVSSPNSFSILRIIANPIGSIIKAVAVFDIHIDKKAVAAIKPTTIEFGLPPKRLIILKAILLCRSHSSIARASKKPPRKRNITELKYEEAISSLPITPIRGNRIKGIKAVAARGIASVIHQIAIKDATAAVIVI